jgi:signal transduction histidine kinase
MNSRLTDRGSKAALRRVPEGPDTRDSERGTDAEQRQFLGLVSHEFRTPLAVIDGAAQILLLTSDPSSVSFRQAERIRAATRQLTELMDSCLANERLFTDGWRPDKRPENIRSLARNAVRRAQANTDSHCIAHNLSGLKGLFTCDALLIKVLLDNLLDNAVKYSPEGGVISLRGWSEPTGTVCFEIADQGIGIPPDQIGRVTERFYRAWQVSGIAGAGLGLHLVKRIAELHNGSIACKSEPGCGSTFTVSLGNEGGPPDGVSFIR